MTTWTSAGSTRSGIGYSTSVVQDEHGQMGVILSLVGTIDSPRTLSRVQPVADWQHAQELSDRFCHAMVAWNRRVWRQEALDRGYAVLGD